MIIRMGHFFRVATIFKTYTHTNHYDSKTYVRRIIKIRKSFHFTYFYRIKYKQRIYESALELKLTIEKNRMVTKIPPKWTKSI